MATGTTADQVLDGMVAALRDLIPDEGEALDADHPLFSAGRYIGRFTVADSNLDSAGGRTPAVQVAFDSERRVKEATGRRQDRVEGTYIAYCVTDKKKYRDSRAVVLSVAQAVRKRLGAHALSLPIRPLQWQSSKLAADEPAAIAYAVTFTTQYHVDYTVQPTDEEVLESASGEITDENSDRVYLETDATFEES